MKNYFKTKYDLVLFSISFYPGKDTTSRLMSDLVLFLSFKKVNTLVVTINRSYLNSKIVYDDEVEWCDIYRIKVPVFRKNSFISKIMIYFFFIFQLRRIFLKLKGKALILTILPPIFIPYYIMKLSKKYSHKFVAIVHDIIPDIHIRRNQLSKSNILSKVLLNQNLKLFQRSDKIVTIGRDMKEYICKEYNINEDKINVIQNWRPRMFEQDKCRVSAINLHTKNLVYAGNMGEAQNLEVVIHSAYLMNQEPLLNDFNFLLIGNGRKKRNLVQLVKKLNIQNVFFYDYIFGDDYKRMLLSSFALIVSLKPESKGLSVPSKFYDYLSYGKPIIGSVPIGSEIAQSIEEYDLGIVCDPYTPKSILSAVYKLQEDSTMYNIQSKNALFTSENVFNRDRKCMSYFNVINSLMRSQ